MEECYIKLKPKTTHRLTWSNDPYKLELHALFRVGTPCLAYDFGVERLLSILRDDPDTSDIFIVQDPSSTYYV